MTTHYRYVTNVDRVVKIIPMQEIHSIQGSPSYVKGIITVDEKVLPIIDYESNIGNSPTVINKKTCIMIADVIYLSELIQVGILANSIQEIMKIRNHSIYLPAGINNMDYNKVYENNVVMQEVFNPFAYG